jgi:hypothetical protein
MIASNTASSSENEVSIRYAVRGCLERISRHASTPVAFGKANVEHRDIGIEPRNSANRLVFRVRLADDGDVVLRLQQIAKPSAHDLVVVEQEHPDRIAHRRHPPTRPLDRQHSPLEGEDLCP